MVLQDNGGDDLSLSANGPFTFATPAVRSGAVVRRDREERTRPGRRCTVTNGSGTVGSANVTTVAVACSATSPGRRCRTTSTGRTAGWAPNWTAVSDGGLSISSQAVLGSSATAGDIRTGETYASDQSSQVEVTSTQLSGGQWIGPAVRMQNGGQDQYLGIYFWNNGTQQLRLYKRSAGTWIQLGSSYNSGAAGRGDAAAADGGWFDDLVPAERRRPDQRDRQQHHRRRAGDHDLRHRKGRQLGRWRSRLVAARRIRLVGRCRGCRGPWCCRTTAATI